MNRNTKIFLLLCIVWWIVASIILLTIPEETISRTLNGFHSATVDNLMKIVTRGGEGVYITLILLLCLYFFQRKKTNLLLVLAIIIAVLLPTIVTNVIKQYFHAPRPLTVFAEKEWLYLIPGYTNNYFYSFPSGHTTGAFSCFAIASYLSGRRSIFFPIAFFIFAFAVAISRIYLLQHFWEDILWGSIIGVGFSQLILFIFEKKFKKKS